MKTVNILVLGSGGREHAIVWKLRQSPRVGDIYVAQGNGGTLQLATNVSINEADVPRLVSFIKDKRIDLVIVGPEGPLVAGIVDKLQGIVRVFGPNKQCAELEGSKAFSKEFMIKHHIPTAQYKEFSDPDLARDYLKKCDYPVVIKADGLAAGKGVVIATYPPEAEKAIEDMMEHHIFGKAGNKIIIEAFLVGEEASILAFVDQSAIVPMVSAQDHKTIYNGDLGPNTGGMGAYSPAPVITPEVMKKIQTLIFDRVRIGLRADRLPYRGVLFVGVMVVKEEPFVLEFNVRFGDPETQAVLMRLETDLLTIIEAVCDDKLSTVDISWKKEPSVSVVLASDGYPGDFEKDKLITGLDKVAGCIFHAGTRSLGNEIRTSGGRVLSVTSSGATLRDAIQKVYSDIDKIQFEGKCYRTDIGQKAINRSS